MEATMRDGTATTAWMTEHDIRMAVNTPAAFKKGRFTILRAIIFR